MSIFQNMPDMNRILVGDYEMKMVKDLKTGDVIVQFGVKNHVLEVIVPKRFAILPSSRRWKLIIGPTDAKSVWKNLPADASFRVLK